MEKKEIKVLVLLSGGLDSTLAVKALVEQGIAATALVFKSLFFGSAKAEESAKALGVPLKIIDFSKKHLEMVKKPKYGYGKGFNPCVDCHLLMLKEAKAMTKIGTKKPLYDFVATGEVLGERPMSQNKGAMEIIEKESGLTGYLLRPLSAQLLKETIPEKNNWVDRKKLFNIYGRSRKKQMELAKKWGIKKYPSPAGGCLLCEIEFGKKMRELLVIRSKANENDIQLLKIGRHFWSGKTKIIVGRNHQENLQIKKLAKKRDVLMELKDIPCPTILVRSYEKKKLEEAVLEEAKKLLIKYSLKAKGKKFKVQISNVK